MIAGTGSAIYSGDNGAATSAALKYPSGVAVDSAGTSLSDSYISLFNLQLFLLYLGNIYIADSSSQRIRKVTVSTGIITTYAGTGTSSYSGDGGAATSAALNYPARVAFDSAGTHSSLLL